MSFKYGSTDHRRKQSFDTTFLLVSGPGDADDANHNFYEILTPEVVFRRNDYDYKCTVLRLWAR